MLTNGQMIAAVYARKSTEQTGVADDQKSVTRQIEHARAYATAKGWLVDPAHVYVDDGISGAEFANRPGLPSSDERIEAASIVQRADHVGGIAARA
jgi:DNA invertase Pin-like site-specific DNA recombinase